MQKFGDCHATARNDGFIYMGFVFTVIAIPTWMLVIRVMQEQLPRHEALILPGAKLKATYAAHRVNYRDVIHNLR